MIPPKCTKRVNAPGCEPACKCAHTIALNIDDKCGDQQLMSFDTDSRTVVCDNSANVHICKDKTMYVSDITPVTMHEVATIGGRGHAPAGVGTVRWNWIDGSGVKHTYLVENVLYFPQSPINILSVTEFAR